jgi:hypothetical protein
MINDTMRKACAKATQIWKSEGWGHLVVEFDDPVNAAAHEPPFGFPKKYNPNNRLAFRIYKVAPGLLKRNAKGAPAPKTAPSPSVHALFVPGISDKDPVACVTLELELSQEQPSAGL